MQPPKSNVTKKSSAFLLTLNQIEKFQDIKDYVSSLSGFVYGIAGKEKAPKTGHEHIHMYVQYSSGKRLAISKLLGCHVDKCFGSAQQNQRYVSKSGNVIWETGEMKKKGFISIKDLKEMPTEERLLLPIHYFNAVEKLNTQDSTDITPLNVHKDVKVYYISGRSGIGKTRFAHGMIGKETFNVVKFENGFWMGVTSKTRIALYDDWRDNHMDASEFLHFIDYNRQIMNVKGGFLLNNYSVIIITSIIRLKDIYQDSPEESREQWERRVKEIFLSTVKNDDLKKYITCFILRTYKYIRIKVFKIIKNFNIK